MKRLTAGISWLAFVSLTSSAHAFVPVPVGGHPGEVDVSLRVGFELGKVEPTENQDSWRKANWQVYQVGFGYTYGTIGPFEDVFFRVDNTFFSSPAETSNPEDLVDADSPQPAACLGVQKSGYCEFYPSDRGWLLQPSLGTNLVHKADYSFGLFVQGTIPIGVNLERFQLPRVDYVAGGTQLGVHVTPWLGYSSRMYVGSGAFGGDHRQNAGVVLTNLFILEAKEWLLPWKIGISLGPYFEGDLTERVDPIYDAAYTPAGRTDPIRSIKFGTIVSPYVQITDYVALEAGYLQKFFGDDAQATQFWYAGARAALYGSWRSRRSMGYRVALVPRPVSPKTALVMVGLPARGKSHITRKVARYLTWLGYTTQVFNVGNTRRERLGEQKPQQFYDPNNVENTRARREIAMITLREMLTWLRRGGDVGIYDATNTTRARREAVQEMCETEGVHVVFIESVCNDEELIDQNVRATKLGSPDYAGWDPEDAVRDFRGRIAHYESVYEPIEDDSTCYVKLIDGGRKFVANRMDQQLNQRVLFFLMNLRITAPIIWLTRHGESLFNLEGRIGGDADVSPRGEEYARRLATFFANNRSKEQALTVWTSTMRRTMQTAAYLPEVPRTYRSLNEIDAGVCDGMTYEQIRKERPKEFAARAADKLRYRYPRGESYEDVIQRLDPRILNIERQQSPLLIIAHQAVLRSIYGYFMGRPPRECPGLSIPLHTIIKLTPNPYGCDEERFSLGPDVPSSVSMWPDPPSKP